MTHEPTLTRESDWGPVRITCSCGTWHTEPTTRKGDPMTQAHAWELWEAHHRPKGQGMSGMGTGYAAVRLNRPAV